MIMTSWIRKQSPHPLRVSSTGARCPTCNFLSNHYLLEGLGKELVVVKDIKLFLQDFKSLVEFS